MQNDGIVEVGAEIAITSRLRTEQAPAARRVRDGEENVVVARGGFDPRLAETDSDEDEGDVGKISYDFTHLPWYKRPSIYWLLPTFVILAMAYGGTMVPKLNLILTLICRTYMEEKSMSDVNFTYLPVLFGQENPQCRNADVQARVATFQLYAQLISGILSAITSPKLGALSDRYGRKRMIALISCGAFCGEIITILVAQFPESFSVNWMLFGYAMDGLSGSMTASMALIHSYASDCTPPAQRSTAFGYFHACLFSGMAMGPLITAYIIKATGSSLPIFYIAVVVHICFILFLLGAIPESLSKARQRAAREKYHKEQEDFASSAHWADYGIASDWVRYAWSINFLAPLKILYPTGEGSSSVLRRNFLLLSAVDTIIFGVAMSMMTVIVLYVNFLFGWADVDASKFMSVISVSRVVALIVLLPIINKVYRRYYPMTDYQGGADTLDLTIIRLGVLFDTGGFIGYALSKTPAPFIFSGMLASVGGIASPTLQSALTKHVPAEMTGQLLGATGLLHALSRVFGPLIFNGIYSLSVKTYPPTVFLCLGGIFGLAFLGSWFVKPHVALGDSPGGRSRTRSNDDASDETAPLIRERS